MDGIGESLERIDRFEGGFSVDDEVHEIEHLLCALAAEDAFTARFILRELHEEASDLYHACLLVHDDEAARSDRGADFS